MMLLRQSVSKQLLLSAPGVSAVALLFPFPTAPKATSFVLPFPSPAALVINVFAPLSLFPAVLGVAVFVPPFLSPTAAADFPLFLLMDVPLFPCL